MNGRDHELAEMPDLEGAYRSLGRHGKTFRQASFLLPEKVANDAAIVYRFCRAVDDAVDECSDEPEAFASLKLLERQIAGNSRRTTTVNDYVGVVERLGIPKSVTTALVSGVRSDIGRVRIQSVQELGFYAYRVAGVVGHMMAHILRINRPEAIQFAVDLGLAMQLTNICRDVLEDATKDRVYLPADLLVQHDILTKEILLGTASGERLSAVVGEILGHADTLYDRARHGLGFIPLRSRAAICIALCLYQAIGHKLLKVHHGNPMHGRTVLTTWERCVAGLSAAADFVRSLPVLRLWRKLPSSPFGVPWSELAKPCRLDDHISFGLETKIGSYHGATS